MKKPTSPLGKLSIFSSESLQNTKLNTNVAAPSLTAVATNLGVSSITSMASIEPISLSVYLGCIILGIACLPGFTSGLLLGSLCTLAVGSLSQIMQFIDPLYVRNSHYYRYVLDNPLTVTITAPLIEELIFRGLLLTVALIAVTTLFPITTTIMMWETGISLAAAIAISAVAMVFGLVHLGNEHEGAYRQAFIATLSGIAFGVMALQFGLGTAIGAHVINNSISYTIAYLSDLGFLKPSLGLSVQSEESDTSELNFAM
ncbi:CAAX amino terminal protease self- immunity [Legionella moravica]|uniref:CAAX amino terminal protease self- immunity n=1 Tax=Legionella moravica TaxID=39962 RepID=A0A378K4J7_9GAMM|nr:CAAX amino terminal protease self- immunity [Legionella moravica]STX62791.1 CAAX amino terminal protease self- immunity [Legionella moravica]